MAKDGFEGRMLRVDLSSGKITKETIDAATMRRYVGGVGLGAKILYEEVPPGVQWNDPENRLIITSGPLGGTRVMGSGTISVSAKGPLTNGATGSQANGYMGAYMRFSGFDGVVIQGASDKLVYLYIHDGEAELRDASHLAGLDTWKMQDAIGAELGKKEREISAFGIGPAGEHLVKFAAIAGDRGHVAGHNGTGAVMGSKKLKAIVAARSSARVEVKDSKALVATAREIIEEIKSNPATRRTFDWGTGMGFNGGAAAGTLPIKNYSTSLFAETDPFMANNYRERYKIKPSPCWACQMRHLHMMTIPDGPYAGFVGEEPEYEQWAAWGPVIGNTNVDGALVLANEIDRLGFENNETGWLIGWVMECFEKGIFTEKDTDGLKMNWGNVEAARTLLHKIAHRDGFGDFLAEGVMRASQKIGGEAAKYAIYTLKGNSPRDHDHRARWHEMFDTATSSTGTLETGPLTRPAEFSIKEADPFNGIEVSTNVAIGKGRMLFEDSLGTCRFCTRTDVKTVVQALNAATGWDMTADEAMEIGRRIANIFRSFNVMHGIAPDLEKPSVRYGSVPVDGPHQGRSVAPEWEGMLDNYYKLMEWDRETGKPLPETLRRYGLDRQLEDLWGVKTAS